METCFEYALTCFAYISALSLNNFPVYYLRPLSCGDSKRRATGKVSQFLNSTLAMVSPILVTVSQFTEGQIVLHGSFDRSASRS
jgi:hypothetical protein